MSILLDTGPLVAFLNKHDTHYQWALRTLSEHEPPWKICEAVITEVCFLTRQIKGAETVVNMLRDGILEVDFQLQSHQLRLHELLPKYQDVPISLADACLICMSEIFPQQPIITIDSDFKIYRRFRNQVIPVIMPKKL